MTCHNIALNRIAKLKALIIYEKISIKINIGNKIKGHSGIKIYKNCILWIINPIKKIDKHTLIDNQKIIIIWLVNANPNGNKLNKFIIKINVNNVKINGKYAYPWRPICCFTKLKINLTKLSQIYWNTVGISFRLLTKYLIDNNKIQSNNNIGANKLIPGTGKNGVKYKIISNCLREKT